MHAPQHRRQRTHGGGGATGADGPPSPARRQRRVCKRRAMRLAGSACCSPRRAPRPCAPLWTMTAIWPPPRHHAPLAAAATLRPQKKRTVNAMSTQPKDTYGLNLVPARARTLLRGHVRAAWRMRARKRTYDGSLVDESEEPAHRRQAPALIRARLARGRGCVEAESSPRLLLEKHRGPSGAQEGGRADEEQQHDEEGVEVEQRRLRPRQAASAPRWVGWSGVLVRGAHHARRPLQPGGGTRKLRRLERERAQNAHMPTICL